MSDVTRNEYETNNRRIDEHLEREDVRLDKHSENIDKLTAVSVELGALLKKHDESIDAQDARIRELEQRPVKRWDGAVSVVISALVSAAIAYFMGGGV